MSSLRHKYYFDKNIDLLNGLIAYYPFNGNANDESGNNHNAIFNNAVLTADRNAGANKAYNFTASSQNKITLLEKTYVPLTNVSISFWAVTTNSGGGSTLRPFGNENSASGTHGLAMYYGGGKPQLIMRNSGTSYDLPWNSFVVSNNWYHYAITISSTGGLRLYLNGSFNGSNINAKSYTSASNTYFNIGCSGDGLQFFNGKIDEFRIYNRVLTQSEITALYGI